MKDGVVRQLGKEEPLPYGLLLLADERVDAIDKYIHQSAIYVLEQYVPEQEVKTIAVYVLYPINAREIEIKNIAVAQPFQRQGIGTILLNDATAKAKAMGYEEIWIGTGNASMGPLFVYQKAGFEIDHIKNNFFVDNYPEPIFEAGISVKHMIMLKKDLTGKRCFVK